MGYCSITPKVSLVPQIMTSDQFLGDLHIPKFLGEPYRVALNNKQCPNRPQTLLAILVFKDTYVFSVSRCATISPFGRATPRVSSCNSREEAVDDETKRAIGNAVNERMFWEAERVLGRNNA